MIEEERERMREYEYIFCLLGLEMNLEIVRMEYKRYVNYITYDYSKERWGEEEDDFD